MIEQYILGFTCFRQMAGGNLGPVPAHLIFLSELPHADVGSKVRFLGWSEPHLPSPPLLRERLLLWITLMLIQNIPQRT